MFTFLLFSKGEGIVRCYKYIERKLEGIGESAVKDFFRWVKNMEHAIYNERVQKAIVSQLQVTYPVKKVKA